MKDEIALSVDGMRVLLTAYRTLMSNHRHKESYFKGGVYSPFLRLLYHIFAWRVERKAKGLGCSLMPRDEELEQLRHQRMSELIKRLRVKEGKEERKREEPKRILRMVLTDRAWEVLKAAESQYPKDTRQIEEHLAHQVSKGELEGPILSGQLLWLFRHLGMNVRLETRICILEHGKLKTIGEKLKGERCARNKV